MTSEQKPNDEQGGFETRPELWHGDTPYIEPQTAEAPDAAYEHVSPGSRRALLWFAFLAVAAVVLGVLIYFLVTSL